MNRKKSISLLLFHSLAVSGIAQNMTSPYSIYGIGDIDTKRYDKTSGMAGTSMALKSTGFLLNNNPASVTGLPRSFLAFNVATLGRSVNYSGNPVNTDNRSNRDFWIKGLSLGVKINNWWGSALSFRQYSNINYTLNGSQFVEGTASSYQTLYTGDGSLSEYAWANGASIGKHFSFGIKAAFIGGGITRTETIDDPGISSAITTTVQDYYGNFRFEYGGLYNTALSKGTDFSLGLKYVPGTTLAGDRTLTIAEGNSAVVDDEYLRDLEFGQPETFSAGLAFIRKKRTTFAADYTHENWSALNIKGPGWALTSTNRVSAGIEFRKWGNSFGQIYEKRFVQFGAFYGNSYILVRDTPINEFGFTTGIGGHLKGNLSYGLSATVGQRGTTLSNLIRENYAECTITLSYSEFLRSKIKKYRYD